MRGAARAIAWELGRHHRFGLLALLAYLVVFALVRVFLLDRTAGMRFDPPNGLAAFVVVPVTLAYFFFVAVFTYGLSSDIAARESTFPKRMFALPATTAALAFWPMLYGAGVSAAVWIVARFFAWGAGGDESGLPWVWPMFLLIAWLAWMQAFTWMPYGLRGIRVVIAIGCLTMIDAVVMLAIYLGASERTMIAFLAPQWPLAYLVAWFALVRARRGDVPDWSFGLPALTAARNGNASLRSPGQAQAWFEWRSHGWTLPSLVAAIVPFELLLLFVPGHDTAPIVFDILFLVIITPPLLALLAAPAFASFTTHSALRPLSSAALVTSKLRVAGASTLAAWMVAVGFTLAALVMSGTMTVFTERLGALVEAAGPLRGAAVIALTLGAFVAMTWKNLVQSLCIGLTARTWLIRTSVLAVFVMLVAIWPILFAIGRSESALFFLWDNLPWFAAAVVCLKLGAAAWIAWRLHGARVLGDTTLVAGTAVWLVLVIALAAFIRWVVDAPIVPFYLLAAVAILAVPLVRVSAAPLALDWSRHR